MNTPDRPLCLSPDVRLQVRNRLHRLGGQIAGIQRMMDEERGCQEILTQIASIKQATNGLIAELVRAHVNGTVLQWQKQSQPSDLISEIDAAVKNALRHG